LAQAALLTKNQSSLWPSVVSHMMSRGFCVCVLLVAARARRDPTDLLDVEIGISGTKNLTSARWALGMQGRACVRRVSELCALLSPLACGVPGNPEEAVLQDQQRADGPSRCLRRYSSCSLVGSSYHLMNGSLGDRIDRNEAVIRVNGAPSGGRRREFAPHVGTRTTTRFINSFGLGSQDERDDETCVFLYVPKVPCKGCSKIQDWDWRTCPGECGDSLATAPMSCQAQHQPAVPAWGDRASVIADFHHGTMAERIRPRPTAGFTAFTYALQHCEAVHVFGFGPTCDGTRGSRYYENKIKVQVKHAYNQELEMLKSAERNGPQSIMPKDLSGMVFAKSVHVHLPTCVSASVRLG